MKHVRWIAVALALSCVVAVGLSWWLTPVWPEFPVASTKEPQLIVETKRDFAFHIGDLVPVDLYIRQMPGTTVDVPSLAVDGDFEMAGLPSVSKKELPDHSVAYRLHLTLQSFKVGKPEVSLHGTLGWNDGDKRLEVMLPETSVFTSNTWDHKRKELKEGPDPRVSVYWYGARHAVPLAVSSLLFLVLTAVAVRNFIRARRALVRVDLAKERVLELLDRIRTGALSKQEHLELDGLIRTHFGVGPIPAGNLQEARYVSNVVSFLQLNEPAIYAQDALNQEGKDELRARGEQLLNRW